MGDKFSPRCPPGRAKGQHMGCYGEMHPPGSTKSHSSACSTPKYCNPHHKSTYRGSEDKSTKNQDIIWGEGLHFQDICVMQS